LVIIERQAVEQARNQAKEQTRSQQQEEQAIKLALVHTGEAGQEKARKQANEEQAKKLTQARKQAEEEQAKKLTQARKQAEEEQARKRVVEEEHKRKRAKRKKVAKATKERKQAEEEEQAKKQQRRMFFQRTAQKAATASAEDTAAVFSFVDFFIQAKQQQLCVLRQNSAHEDVETATASADGTATVVTTPMSTRALSEPNVTPHVTPHVTPPGGKGFAMGSAGNSVGNSVGNSAAAEPSLMAEIDAQIQSFPYVGPTMSKMLMLTIHLHFPRLGLLSNDCPVGDGAWAAFSFLLESSHTWRAVEYGRSANLRQRHLRALLDALLGMEHAEHAQATSCDTSTEPSGGEGDGGSEGCTKTSLSKCGGQKGEQKGEGKMQKEEGKMQKGGQSTGVAEQVQCAEQEEGLPTKQEEGLMAQLEPRFVHMLQFTADLSQRTLCHEQARLPPSAIAGTLNPADLQVVISSYSISSYSISSHTHSAAPLLCCMLGTLYSSALRPLSVHSPSTLRPCAGEPLRMAKVSYWCRLLAADGQG
jgi:hypothetical protein